MSCIVLASRGAADSGADVVDDGCLIEPGRVLMGEGMDGWG